MREEIKNGRTQELFNDNWLVLLDALAYIVKIAGVKFPIEKISDHFIIIMGIGQPLVSLRVSVFGPEGTFIYCRRAV